MKIIFYQVNKNYGNQEVIKNFNFTFINKNYVVLGNNGSGKSTLLKLISNLILPNSGNINYYDNNLKISNEQAIKNISFTAPYLELIEELDINSLLKFHYKFKNPIFKYETIIKMLGLSEYKNKKIYELSSGIKQRLKLLLALNTQCNFTILDEPTTNLDDNGKEMYYNLFKKFKNKKSIIIATNDKKDVIESDIEIIKVN